MTAFYYLFNILLVTGLGYLLWRQQIQNKLKIYFWPAFGLKLISGILLALYYDTYFGGGDARLFQSQADLVTEYARTSPGSYLRLLFTRHYESQTLRTSMIYIWYSNSYFMVMVLSFFNFLSGGHYLLNSLYFSLYSFFGLWQLTSTLTRLNLSYKYPALIAFLFFPSVVFWSAGVGKEAIYLGSLAWLVGAVLRLLYNLNGTVGVNILEILVAGYLTWKIKFYFAALVFALLFGFAAGEWLNKKFNYRIKLRAGWYFLLFFLVAGTVLVLKENEVINIENFFFQLMRSYSTLSQASIGKPALVFPGLEPTFVSLLQHSPSAVFQTILRPYVWEGNHIFYFISGLENFLVLVLLILTGVRMIRKFPVPVPLGVWAILIYILIISALIGLFTPNIGSLSRYKTAFMPFLVFLLLVFNYPYTRKKSEEEFYFKSLHN